MYNLKLVELFLVGDIEDKRFFETYFKDVILLKYNSETLNLHPKDIFSIIFLKCDSKKDDAFEILKKIRANDSKRVIVMTSYASDITIDRLQKALSLNISGCVKKPFQQSEIKNILHTIEQNLEFLFMNIVRLKDGYFFDKAQNKLYSIDREEITLTKLEHQLIEIFIQSENTFISSVNIEQQLWEEDSALSDCNKRFRNILVNLRKKLPKNSIINNYGIGYKLVCC